MPSWPGVFKFGIFEFYSEIIMVYIYLKASSDIWNFFRCCLSLQHFIMISPFPYFTPKTYYFSWIWLLVSLHILSLFEGNIFHVSECSVLSLLFVFFFCLPCLATNFWCISSSFIFSSNCVPFSHCSNTSLFLCLIIFAGSRKILCFQSNFPSRFVFSLSVLQGNPTFSETYFAQA